MRIGEFLKDVKVELRKVSWPSRQETIKLTGVVILISVILAAFLGLLDFGFITLLNRLLF
ncbi:MAG: preprotein translocase subunit SecE [Parcubacteria group bacterium]|nr:preprotein translocase subunit SecE [Parcubacteria group bacterium]